MKHPNEKPLLWVENLKMQFGGILALNEVTFAVQNNSITALIGPNGAGKTTVFNCITGFYKASAGRIDLNVGKTFDIVKILGQNFSYSDFLSATTLLTKLYYKLFGGSHLVNRAGIARTFQNIRLFSEMTVIENLMVAQHQKLNHNLLSGLFNTRAYALSEEKALQVSLKWLDFCHLSEDANRLAGDLPYGHQRRLEIARAMCTEPRLICLDEPAAGLNPNETKELSQLILDLRNQYDVSVLLIEHDMSMVMDISDTIIVLDYGEVIASGNAKQIRENKTVIKAYLGEEAL